MRSGPRRPPPFIGTATRVAFHTKGDAGRFRAAVTSDSAAGYILRMRRLIVVLVFALLAAGCDDSKRATLVSEKPPAPGTWPAYPKFEQRSCWTRRRGTGVMRSAPSFVSSRRGKPVRPAEIVRRLLARFGEPNHVHRIVIGAPPPRSQIRGFFPGRRPPSDGLWAYIDAPYAIEAPRTLGASARPLARWETELVGGALRDDFCSAGGRPLVGWSVGDQVSGISDGTFALGQRFPNPPPKAFLKQVRQVGKAHGFRITLLKLYRPRQLAPLLVVRTSRERKAFVKDVPAILSLLNPTSNGSGHTAVTFEGFFFEARDAKGAFLQVLNAYRGEIMGGQWSWDRCVYPYRHSEPVSAKPCPS
jgi:hypothetical protein